MPLEITYRDIEKSDSIDDLIREKAAKLDAICQDIISCRVVVEKPQEFQRSGSPYRVRINLRIPPGHEVVAERKSGQGQLHEPLQKVIRSAFDATERQVRELDAKRRREVKLHPKQQLSAVVVRLFSEQGYGFIKDLTDGHEIFFHRNSVIHDDFERLQVGTGVRHVETAGEEGPQASTVQILDKSGGRGPKTDEEPPGVPSDWK